jgi:hypothetical protein
MPLGPPPKAEIESLPTGGAPGRVICHGFEAAVVSWSSANWPGTGLCVKE